MTHRGAVRIIEGAKGNLCMNILRYPWLLCIVKEPVSSFDEGMHDVDGGDALIVLPLTSFRCSSPSSPVGVEGVGVGVPRESMETMGSLDKD